jgi:hypothetical protein
MSDNGKRQYHLTAADDRLLDRLAKRYVSNRSAAFRLAIRRQAERDLQPAAPALRQLYALVAATVPLADQPAERGTFRMDPADFRALQRIDKAHALGSRAAAARFAIRVQAALEGLAAPAKAG